MERVLAGESREHIGSPVLLRGWLHHQRQLSRVSFLLLRDRFDLAQVVVEEESLRRGRARRRRFH
jgi:nondiscriminating aspartyl-tRNA synthetase